MSKRKLNLKQLKKDLRSKKEYKKAFYFLLYFVIFFLLFYIILNYTFIYKIINYIYGYISYIIIKYIFHFKALFTYNIANNCSVIILENTTMVISRLCSAILEFSLITSAILASRGILWKKRIIGVLIVIPIIFLFNIFRIILTTLIITYFNLDIATFFHSFLFRIFLIIIVIGYYFIWLKKNFK